ncbi:nuclear transport factor 2 family protein [Streptacidiphilus sp. EB129]|uniref:nuclear transport factor 2 family protein n=1 Tax=Streptacidiphilus sp. EB129 TaxID=3156262 RepID=UPI003519C6B3
MAADRTAMEDTWQAHTDSEFVHPDVDATMATMTDNPTVLHVPTAMGGRGRDGVRDFYERWFLGRNPQDFTLRSVSRTVGDDRIVDEMVVSFTHDLDVPWILPGVAPTGRPVRIPLVAIVGFRGAAIDSEHIYWDQAAVLAQTLLLDANVVAHLPVVTEQSDVLEDSPLNMLALLPSERS